MVTIRLNSPEGNAFYILGVVKTVLRKSGIEKTKIDEILNEMQSSDYEHLCDVASQYVRLTGRNSKKYYSA